MALWLFQAEMPSKLAKLKAEAAKRNSEGESKQSGATKIQLDFIVPTVSKDGKETMVHMSYAPSVAVDGSVLANHSVIYPLTKEELEEYELIPFGDKITIQDITQGRKKKKKENANEPSTNSSLK